MKKIIAFLLFFTILFSLPVFSSFALQDLSPDSSISTSDVLTDLEKMYFDGKKFNKLFYPHIPTADYVLLLNFFEYGYSSSSSKDYNLYLYVYNPSGKVITDSVKNKIQLSVNEVRYYKYSLQLVSASDDNLFLKFKVVYPISVYDQLRSSTRNYMISGIELLLKAPNATEFKVASQFTYTGSHANNTLYCQKDALTTIQTELHQTFYRLDSSSRGAYYYAQIDSFYFALDHDLLEKYVMKSLFLEYTKQLVNWVVIDNDEYSDITKAIHGTQAGNDEWDYHITSIYGDEFSLTPYFTWNYDRDLKDVRLPFIMAGFYVEDSDDLLHRDMILSQIHDKNSLDLYKTHPEVSRFSPEYVPVEIPVDKVFSAVSYSENHGWLSTIWEVGFFNWLFGLDETVSCSALDIFDYDDLYLPDSELSKKYLIDLSDISEFRKNAIVYKNQSKDLILFRFSTQDYYSMKIDIGVGDYPWYDPTVGAISAISDGYYAEEYGYFDLDVMSAKFEDKAGVVTSIPFVSSPIDVLGSGESPDSADKSEDDKGKEQDNKNNLKMLVAIIMLVLALFFVIWVIGKVAPRRYRVTGGSSGRRRRRR